MKTAMKFLALAMLVSAALGCGGGTAIPTEGAQATQPAEAAATATQSQAATAAPAATSAGALTEHGTPEEAQAMLKVAVEHYNSVGRVQALADFTGEVAPFVDRDLYVLCIDANHVIAANGGYPTFVGTSADVILTSDHTPLGSYLWEAAATSREGSVEYIHINPVSKQVEPKLLFYQQVEADLICGVGAYSPPPA